ncbi:MAG: MBL fold metallo-hydrolase [Betaproteobacteria bacterium]|nr:MBL fold metallo-hydrolase [Betaproteobacteria bacterium]
MRFASLGSGSQGNALVVEVSRTRVLMDCGFPLRETLRRLARLGLDPAMLDAIVVTHEHDDHVGGVLRLARRHGLPVWLTHGTARAIGLDPCVLAGATLIDGHHSFAVGDIEVQPYPVPHDAREAVQFVFGDGCRRLGVLTDTGCSTPHIQETLTGCDALVLECNHDPQMLASGPYPERLKRRIASRLGHLGNDASAELLASLDTTRLKHIVAAHLSQTNNAPELARHALARALDCEPEWIGVADQDEGFAWRTI